MPPSKITRKENFELLNEEINRFLTMEVYENDFDCYYQKWSKSSHAFISNLTATLAPTSLAEIIPALDRLAKEIAALETYRQQKKIAESNFKKGLSLLIASIFILSEEKHNLANYNLKNFNNLFDFLCLHDFADFYEESLFRVCIETATDIEHLFSLLSVNFNISDVYVKEMDAIRKALATLP